VRFTAAVTLPAHATMLTGLHPAKHTVPTNDGFRLAPNVPTWPPGAARPRLRHRRVHRWRAAAGEARPSGVKYGWTDEVN
jgi:hypothetical protein